MLHTTDFTIAFRMMGEDKSTGNSSINVTNVLDFILVTNRMLFSK